MGIAIVNTVFKVVARLLLTPFAGLLEKLAIATIKEKKSEEDDEAEENLLDARFLNYPAVALEQCGKTVQQMSKAAFKNLRKSMELFSRFNREKYDKIMSRENRVDQFEDRLGAYLVQLNGKPLTERESQLAARYLGCLTNLERVSDHAVNLAELAEELEQKKVSFSDMAARELEICMNAVREIVELTEAAMKENNAEKARLVEPLEAVIDVLTKELKNRHIQRVQAGMCTLQLGFVFNDCVNNLERVADHCSNIALTVLEGSSAQLQSHNYLRSMKEDNKEEFRIRLDQYAKQYYDALTSLDALEV